MRRIEWLRWRMQYGDPTTRTAEMRFFMKFELYNLLCILSGYRIAHWLNRKPPGPAGKYLRVVRAAPLLVQLMDRRFAFAEESHCDYLPYTAETEQQLRCAGKLVSIVEISYKLTATVF
ncbi:MAG TPA: hypothetical protein VGJ48_27015 [Pyrinomonadaceae bacterium]|jgi:hypothetical protein